MRHFSLQTLTMSLKVTLLVVSLISQCCSAPYRRNWTPQAILYLKGAQGQRSTLERSSREEEGAYRLVNFNEISDGTDLFPASVVQSKFLQRPAEAGEGRPEYHQDWNLKYM
ncbi:spexin-like [Cyprinodon tularosa]|uniref:spexin-like n=1 Tax=Cyprinodon tularosa TaxID=77115 RepID=UPI0018E217D5|nr:spexin-like [Cyprinodon tularosa]